MIEQKSNSRKIILALLGLFILAGLLVVGYYIYKKQTTLTEQAIASPTPTKPAVSSSPFSSRGDPRGPYYHQIFSATSSDGLTWIKANNLIFDHASVPGAVLFNQKIYLYFVDASSEEDQLSVAVSENLGKTFDKKKVSIENTCTGCAVDPHPEVINGKIHLYYFQNPIVSGGKEESAKIYSAESTDGINFVKATLAFENPQIITDPDVFETSEDWRMFVSEGTNLILAISSDGGKTFTKDASFSWNKGGVCDTLKMDEVYRTFYCGQGGIKSATGADVGELLEEAGTRIKGEAGEIVCDPTIIQLPDGSYLMFYKIQKASQP